MGHEDITVHLGRGVWNAAAWSLISEMYRATCGCLIACVRDPLREEKKHLAISRRSRDFFV